MSQNRIRRATITCLIGLPLVVGGCGGGGDSAPAVPFPVTQQNTASRTVTSMRAALMTLSIVSALPVDIDGRSTRARFELETTLASGRGRAEDRFFSNLGFYVSEPVPNGTYKFNFLGQQIDTGIVSAWLFKAYSDEAMTNQIGDLVFAVKKINELGFLQQPPNPYPATGEWSVSVLGGARPITGVIGVTLLDSSGKNGDLAANVLNGFGERLQSNASVRNATTVSGNDRFDDESGFSVVNSYQGLIGGDFHGEWTSGSSGSPGGLRGTYTIHANRSGSVLIFDLSTGQQVAAISFDAQGKGTLDYSNPLWNDRTVDLLSDDLTDG